MGLRMNYEEFNKILDDLSKDYKVYAPTSIDKKGRFSDTDVVGMVKYKKYRI